MATTHYTKTVSGYPCETWLNDLFQATIQVTTPRPVEFESHTLINDMPAAKWALMDATTYVYRTTITIQQSSGEINQAIQFFLAYVAEQNSEKAGMDAGLVGSGWTLVP